MSALENAKKLSREAVAEKIAALNISDYGITKEKIRDKLSAALEEAKSEEIEPVVVCGLNNADTDGVLLELLKTNPEKIMEGIGIVAYVMGTERKILHLPEYDRGLEETIRTAAEAANVEIDAGLIDLRKNRGAAVIHVVTAETLADVFTDSYIAGIYVSASGQSIKKVKGDTLVSEIIDLDNAKAVLAGYQFYPPKIIGSMTVEDANIDNGVLRAIGGEECIVTMTEKKLTASRRHSCGKCVFCREGLLQLQLMAKDISDGKGRMEYIDIVKEIGEAMIFSTSCTMGQNASRIVLSAMESLEGEYEAHIKRKECPAGICFSSETVYIDPQLCTGCGECMEVCPKDCIEGKAKFIHMIDEFDCDKCEKCMAVCSEEAIIKTSGKVPKLPDRLIKVGRFKKY